MTASLIKKFPLSPVAYSTRGRDAHLAIKERRELLRTLINTSSLSNASQLRINPLVCVLKFRNINLIPFRDFTVLPNHLGPTNSCMIANRKKTFPTTIFKALQTCAGCVAARPLHIPYPVWIIATITEICTNNRSTCFHNLDKLPRNCKRHPTLCIFTTINAEVREKLHIWAPSIFRATPFDS